MPRSPRRSMPLLALCPLLAALLPVLLPVLVHPQPAQAAGGCTAERLRFPLSCEDEPPPPPGPNGEPETRLSGGPHDRLTPGSPVVLTRHPRYHLQASAPASFRCALDGRPTTCRPGDNVVKGRLGAGPHVLLAQAVDGEGRFDRTPARMAFYVPVDLEPTGSWRKVRSRGSFGGDRLVTSRRGDVLAIGRVRGVRELRLLAPTGPGLGTVAIRIGGGRWKSIDLHARTPHALQVFVVRPPGSEPARGVIRVKPFAVPAGGSVAVDAVVAR